jgi:hypothetical protein
LKIYEIRDSSQPVGKGEGRIQGYLFYYEKSKRFYVELMPGLTEWEVPAMFYGEVKKHNYSIDSVWSMKWVRQRIIPAERQNIGAILRDNHLKEYDECKLLELSCGRCAQDDSYIVKISADDIPQVILERFLEKVQDVMPLSGGRAIIFFRDETAVEVVYSELVGENPVFGNVLANEDIMRSVRVSPGGNGIEWDEDRFIPAKQLYIKGRRVMLSYSDICNFVKTRMIDTTAAAERLMVTRQYINQLVKQDRLTPVAAGANTQVFALAEIESM